ncbi:leucyl/phenylalanyl-tRNA--protein transferase [Terricaulis silvestris]|uniref:Leucyl/phenylalanyl-tRNA--protein transferase n=1 Tax=Terricaulis silvestris TaxID=2686094 RepID=A0A6I6MIE0_9CAUL|nr:leucyl/phenylalanyl-tRNA--protein transferase [Terricaulis silvestris]QGZ94840.1 Leucyl/phenylalanyl-tRNA--protein transferase [Terricaulis silvestris]
MKPFSTEDLLACYRRGVFPMAESRADDGFFIVDPEWRCVFPLDRVHVPKRLARTLRSGRFSFTIDRDFAAVIDECAQPGAGREDTWINADIRALYLALAAKGVAHSVEARIGGELVGGLYGVALGGAFFGESMYARATDASKAALVHLAARLRHGGFKLLDAQFITPHLEQFGAQTLPRRIFQAMLGVALDAPADFGALAEDASGAALLEILQA